MRYFLLLLILLSSTVQAQSVFIEDLTWTEIRDAMAKGTDTAIYYAGSTEQNGPHMATGKHNFIARHVAEAIARKLGKSLVYPIMPYAPTGDAERKTGHMRYPGSVSLSEATFVAVARDVAASARAAGFRNILLMADHGDGQAALARLTEALNKEWQAQGSDGEFEPHAARPSDSPPLQRWARPARVRVFFIGDLYERYGQLEAELLTKRRLKAGGHAGLADTASLMAVDAQRRWVRPATIAQARGHTEVEGDPAGASARLGRELIELKVETALRQIRTLLQRN